MRTLYRYFLVLLLLFLLIHCGKFNDAKAVAKNRVPDKIDFNFHVRPILSDRCFSCHGPDEKTREAGLRLDLESFAFAVLDSISKRYAIVPGNLKASQLYHRITSEDPSEVMPPPSSNLKLSKSEIAILSRWIEQGAVWKSHWAFLPPTKNELPGVKDAQWLVNEVDHFVLNRLEQEGYTPSAEASKEKLIRRLSFDLRGIPPSLEEIDNFKMDASAEAYERLVDRFLSQNSFGERLAMDWLDLARYADSHGYQDDIERSMWPWREWVIKAFNNNMPYDEFVTWQLAGDLLPNPTYEQVLATGFNRNHKITQEVGVVDEEYRVEYVLDRVRTVSTAFLGLTVECAQCHDHKFDPISQKEFYEVFSFFNNVPEKGRVEYNVEVAEPSLPLPDTTVSQYRNYIHGLVKSQLSKVVAYGEKAWKAQKEVPASFSEPVTSSIALPEGLKAHYSLDYITEDRIAEEKKGRFTAEVVNNLVPVTGKFSGGLEFSGRNYLNLGSGRQFNFSRPFSLAFWVYSIDAGIRGTILAPIVAQDPESGMALEVSNDKNFYFRMKGKADKNRLVMRGKEEIPENQWVPVVLTYDGSGLASGIQFYMNGKALEMSVEVDEFDGNLPRHEQIWVGRRQRNTTRKYHGLQAGRLDELMFFDRVLSAAEVRELKQYNPLDALMAKEELSKLDARRLLYHQLHRHDREYQRISQRLAEYKIRELRMEDVILKPTMVMKDMDTLRPTYILDRGQYSAPTTRVYPGTPRFVLPFPEDFPRNRLGFAQWLFDIRHPLTARVAVNRYWQMIFGRGLVATPEDFGSQGSLPSHPELLDWLAVDFRESGWDVRRLFRKMVLSATYRQSVIAEGRIRELDPDNVLLARGPQSRLPAEMIRDHCLAISGLLSDRVGGPSVKPYQPAGLWLEMATGNQSLRKYIQDHEKDLYRKSMYTFWKRTVPPPSMMTFDASTREQCLVRRQSTNTPMQALVLLNDPQFMEASRLIAERMLREGGESDADRIGFAFRLATSRMASEEELKLLTELLAKKKKTFATDPEGAQHLLEIGEYRRDPQMDAGELAAYTLVANAILNLTETIRKG